MTGSLDISVIICSRDRADSLKETLNCLARADREGLNVEINVVDNNSKDNTKQVVDSFSDKLPIQFYRESQKGVCGKCCRLNHALDEGLYGKIMGQICGLLNK